jgi:hypothetical protein
MPVANIPINFPVNLSVDDSAREMSGAMLFDGYTEMVDQNPVSVKRPGLKLHADMNTGAAVQKIYYWADKDIAVGVSNGILFKKVKADSTWTQITGATVHPTNRVICATLLAGGTTQTLVLASGQALVYYEGGATAATVTDPDAPQAPTHVTVLDNYVIANDTTAGSEGKFFHADVGQIVDWSAASFFSAEAKADKILALGSADRHLFILGSKTWEQWFTTGAPFARRDYDETGCSAAYSLVYTNNMWHWLSNKNQYVRLEGRNAKVVSSPFDGEIRGMTSFSDVTADFVDVGNKHFIFIQFPTDNVTLVYNYANGEWMKWGLWDSGTSTYNRFLGTNASYANLWGMNLIGSRSDGKVFEFDPDTYRDGGATIRFAKRSGNFSHGMNNRKVSKHVILRLKRGAAGSSAQLAMLRYRNDGNSNWSDQTVIDLNLGARGQTELYQKIRRLGQYRSRQWEVAVTGDVPFSLVNMQENFEVIPE